MTNLKGGALLLVLGIPLALYCVLQVKNVIRADVMTPDPPEDRGATREELAASHAKSAAWLADVRKAAAVAMQYRAPGADEAGGDPGAGAVVRGSAARSADLNDLDLFLSEIERPKFEGKLKPQYERWMAERREVKKDAEAVAAWLAKPPAVTSAADATKAIDEANALVSQYATRSKFSDSAKATAWRLRARLLVTDALANLASAQYRAAIQVTLPLEPGANAVKAAIETMRELKSQMASLGAELKQAEEDNPRLDPAFRAALEARGAVADECAAREELLALFAKDDLFTNAAGVGPWLKQVGAQYRRTKDEKVRALIREKVQEFCGAFIPPQARLDDRALLKGKAVPRKDVVVKYQETAGGAVKRDPLSGDLDGVNEFNLAKRHPGETTFVVYMGSEEYPRDLQPTALSEAAAFYNAERKRLADGTTEPKWTAKSVAELKKSCEVRRDLVDQLKTPGDASGSSPKVFTRLEGLAAGMAGNADLFEVGK